MLDNYVMYNSLTDEYLSIMNDQSAKWYNIDVPTECHWFNEKSIGYIFYAILEITSNVTDTNSYNGRYGPMYIDMATALLTVDLDNIWIFPIINDFGYNINIDNLHGICIAEYMTEYFMTEL